MHIYQRQYQTSEMPRSLYTSNASLPFYLCICNILLKTTFIINLLNRNITLNVFFRIEACFTVLSVFNLITPSVSHSVTHSVIKGLFLQDEVGSGGGGSFLPLRARLRWTGNYSPGRSSLYLWLDSSGKHDLVVNCHI